MRKQSHMYIYVSICHTCIHMCTYEKCNATCNGVLLKSPWSETATIWFWFKIVGRRGQSWQRCWVVPKKIDPGSMIRTLSRGRLRYFLVFYHVSCMASPCEASWFFGWWMILKILYSSAYHYIILYIYNMIIDIYPYMYRVSMTAQRPN